MKKTIQILIILFLNQLCAQVDYSNNWEDFYSYNNVKDFVKVDNIIYAVTDNAIFTYNLNNEEIKKQSSINGLSGETTSSIHYSSETKNIFIGYKTGLLEIIDENNNIHIAKDIVSFNYSGDKSINSITEYNDKLYLSTSFAIIVYDIKDLQFGDTYFIGNQSSEILINDIAINNETIYAATENGVFTANINNPNLIDFNNWSKYSSGNFTAIEVFNHKIYTSKDSKVYEFENGFFTLIKNEFNAIINLKSSNEFLAISKLRSVSFIDKLNKTIFSYTSKNTDNYYFKVNNSFLDEGKLYIGTKEFGILQSELTNPTVFKEIHPLGPSSNLPFSISAKDNHLWVVYGYYNSAYTPNEGKFGIDHLNNLDWNYIPYKDFKAKNLVNVTFDYSNSNKVYVSSWGASNPNDITNTGGMLIIENDKVTNFWSYQNSGLENLFLPASPNYKSTRINGSAFDNKGNLWIANAWVDEKIKKYSANGSWSSFDMSSVITNAASGLNELVIDKTNTIWVGSRRNGALVFNENGNKKTVLITEVTKGSLPDLNVRTIKVDASNRVWLGTKKGLVVYYNAANVFSESINDAEPIIILDNGIAKKLLGEQTINSIEIDGADNKWFGTEFSGVMQTSPNGTEVLNQFNIKNSPLPSNNITKIAIDKSNGKVYFATGNGIVAYNSNVSRYSDTLTDVYAYPNPSTKSNEFITIDGRNGSHLPKGTNIKIVDSAGNLVYETNVKEGQELFGGKVVWNKTNLAGRKVASGIYIVLLSANKATETAVTKIAIIN